MATKILSLCFVIFIVEKVATQKSGIPIITDYAELNNKYINEQIKVGSVLGQVKAQDPDGTELTFTIKGAGFEYFQIDEKTGVVTVKKTLDYELLSDSEINFRVEVKDEAQQLATANIVIYVNDINDNLPQFIDASAVAKFPENANIGEEVRKIEVTDLDTQNSILTVECLDDTDSQKEACATFKLVPTATSNKYYRGYLQLSKTLDYEKRKGYTVNLRAFDGSKDENGNARFTDENIVIEVEDVNDSPPRFNKQDPVTVNEEILLGSTVVTMKAVDTDTNPRAIYYEIIDSTGTFQIDSASGVISNKLRLDYDGRDSRKDRPWDVIVKAREVINAGTKTYGQDASNTATTQIKINMVDINDNKPTFDQNEYEVNIPESIAKGLNIPGLLMTVTDKDETQSFNSFRLETNAFKDIFRIIPTDIDGQGSPTLYIQNPELIDYESGTLEYRVIVTATEDLTPEKYSGSATVIIKVLNVNDNEPKFDKTDYTVSVFENALGGTAVVDLDATDAEEGDFGTAGIRYRLFGNTLNHFKIDPNTGLITVNDCAKPGEDPCIDYETKTRYILSVSATDMKGDIKIGLSRNVQVIVNIKDVNDNRPNPEQDYIRYILEGQTDTTDQLVIEAPDPDTVGGPVTYSIQGDSSNLWQITDVEENGNKAAKITAIRDIYWKDAPNQKKGQFTFTVVSSDTLNTAVSSVTIIVIDVNNNAPRFTSPVYRATLPELTQGEQFVIVVTANDLDSTSTGNGLIDFAIQSGAVGKFALSDRKQNNDDTFSVTIKTTQDSTFDFDKKASYNLVLEARDRGSPDSLTGTATLIVTITDENNRIPVLTPTSKTINVREDTRIGTSVHKVVANDPDANKVLRYFMTPETGTKPSGSPAEVDFKSMFIIDDKTGIVTVNKALNRDSVAFLTNELKVEDQGATPTQTGTGALFIRITEYNDQNPEFEKPVYEVTTTEEIIRNSFIISLLCTDADDDIQSYTLLQTGPSTFPEYFDLLQEGGTMIVNDRIDYENNLKKIELIATCYDSGTPMRSATVKVIVTVTNINDNTPVFTEPTYSASTSEAPRTTEEFLVKVAASDQDLEDYGVVSYKLNDPDDYFRIESDSGKIFVKPNAVFDREMSESYVLQVLAIDSPNDATVRRTATSQVIIRIEDTNDNCPEFRKTKYEGSVPESATGGTNIVDIIADDLDGGLGGMIDYQIKAGSADPGGSERFFSILTRNNVGRLLTQGNLKDRVGIYKFIVTATDMNGDTTKTPCVREVNVEVEIQESDNNAPSWVDPPRRDWVIYVLEEQYEGMLVYDAHASDSNIGRNGLVNYYFINDQNQVVSKTPEFRINRITGVIRAEVIYDRERVDRYFLTLLAKDQGIPAASSETTVIIKILDVDDNDPKFKTQNGRVPALNLPEGQPLPENTDVTQQKLILGNCSYLASDADSSDNENSRIYYRLLTLGLDDTIEVDNNNCKIYLKKELDFEKQQQLSFDIMAYNKKNDDTVIRYKREVNPSILPVIVRIQDTNDNPPKFENPEYLTCASMDVPFKQPLLEVSAVDKDLGDNTELKYSLGVASKEFEISSNEGIVRNIVSFKYEKNMKSVYALDLVVSDSGDQKGFAKAFVFITKESNTVKMKVLRPLREVQNIRKQLINSIVASDKEIHFACISSMRTHIDDDGEERVGATDVMITAVKKSSSGSYSVLSAAALAGILRKGATENSAITAIDVSEVKEHDEDEFFSSLDEDAVLAIFIIAILLIFMTLLLLCIACYCMRRSKNKKKKKLNAQRSTIIGRAHEPVETSFNPVYSNPGFEPEYATVSKMKHSNPPISPVVIAAPVDLQPMSSDEPSYLQPFEADEGNVPVIETEVLPPAQSSMSTFETVETSEVQQHTSTEETVVTDEIDTLEERTSFAGGDADDQIDTVILDDLPEPVGHDMPEHPGDTDSIDVEIIDLPSPPPHL